MIRTLNLKKPRNRYLEVYDNRRVLSKNHGLCTKSVKFTKEGVKKK